MLKNFFLGFLAFGLSWQYAQSQQFIPLTTQDDEIINLNIGCPPVLKGLDEHPQDKTYKLYVFTPCVEGDSLSLYILSYFPQKKRPKLNKQQPDTYLENIEIIRLALQDIDWTHWNYEDYVVNEEINELGITQVYALYLEIKESAFYINYKIENQVITQEDSGEYDEPLELYFQNEQDLRSFLSQIKAP